MAHKILAVNLQEVFANYADKPHQFRAHLLRDHLASLHEQGLWPEDGVSFDVALEKVYDEKSGFTRIGNHKAFLLIGTRENMVSADWAFKEASEYLDGPLFHPSLPSDYKHPGYALFLTTAKGFDGVLNQQEG